MGSIFNVVSSFDLFSRFSTFNLPCCLFCCCSDQTIGVGRLEARLRKDARLERLAVPVPERILLERVLLEGDSLASASRPSSI